MSKSSGSHSPPARLGEQQPDTPKTDRRAPQKKSGSRRMQDRKKLRLQPTLDLLSLVLDVWNFIQSSNWLQVCALGTTLLLLR